MNDPSYAMQVAVVAALLECSGVTTLLAATCDGPAVFDALTRAMDVYPRAEIQHVQAVPPPKTTAGSTNVFVTLDLWADGPGGRLQLQAVSDAIGACFGAALPAPAGYRVVTSQFESVQHLTDPDGITAHSVLTWRFGVSPAPPAN